MTKMMRTLAVSATALAVVALGACSSYNDVATTTDMCAYTQGDGLEGRDAKINKIFYPGQVVERDTHETVLYFACNGRNIRLAPGTTDTDAQGKTLGPIVARNKDGIPVVLYVDMDWMLNQTDAVLRRTTIPFLQKGNSASTDPSVRNENASTDGWSRVFLGENITPAFQASILESVRSYGPEVWENPAIMSNLSEKIAVAFTERIKRKTGETSNMICGSGASSGWTDPSKPGEGTFNCGSVRVTVNFVEPQDPAILNAKKRETTAKQDEVANIAELKAAKAKYGDKAPDVLGDLDRIAACKAATVVCYFTQYGSSGVNNPGQK